MGFGVVPKTGVVKREDEQSPLLDANHIEAQGLSTTATSDDNSDEESLERNPSSPEITREKSARGIIAVLLIGDFPLHSLLLPSTNSCIGVFIANGDGSLVLASYGKIASEFEDLENASWLVTSYVLAMSAAQPLVMLLTVAQMCNHD